MEFWWKDNLREIQSVVQHIFYRKWSEKREKKSVLDGVKISNKFQKFICACIFMWEIESDTDRRECAKKVAIHLRSQIIYQFSIARTFHSVRKQISRFRYHWTWHHTRAARVAWSDVWTTSSRVLKREKRIMQCCQRKEREWNAFECAKRGRGGDGNRKKITKNSFLEHEKKLQDVWAFGSRLARAYESERRSKESAS